VSLAAGPRGRALPLGALGRRARPALPPDENADPFTNAVRVAVMTLRRKLGDPPVIETVPGAGYRIEP
jgi:hypothetical protein